MKNIVIGQYIPGNGFFYRLDPRTKIVAIVALMVSIFLLKNITQMAVAFGIAILALVFGQISIMRILRGLRPILVLLIFTFIFQIMFSTDGTLLVSEQMSFSISSIAFALGFTVLWRVLAKRLRLTFLLMVFYLGTLYVSFRYLNFTPVFSGFMLNIYESGIIGSVFVVVRLLIIITLSTVLTITTKPTDLTSGLEKMMHPLKWIGLSSEDFALMISIALRYIPTIMDEANKIMLAQASRGADFSQGKLKDKAKQVISLLVPMFIIALKRSEDLAEAMESRNFVPGKPRTRIFELKFSMSDVVAIGFTIVCLAASIVVRTVL